MSSSFKGILYPARLPMFHRLPAPATVEHLVQWFWIPEWDIAPGRVSRQQLLAYPACNLVVQPDGMELSGPTTRVSHQDLSGTGWAVGALLKPAAVPFFAANPRELCDARLDVEAPKLLAAVVHAMGGAAPEEQREKAVAIFADWLAEQLPEASAEALLANAMTEAIANNPELVRIEDAAAQLSVSTRTLQRMAKKYVGLSPSALIRRRRLQEAADHARAHPEMDLAAVAAEFGYADQAHLANDFQRFLGITASSYRRAVGAGPVGSGGL
ncbi:Transcriptional regulator, AraC family [Arthrobacter sp. PAMC 25486]|uniref:AraC family transcriptional regulator n=1 Tax=Arthrobacter sp. PAMC 25486 TaxID=1494608 RepID=UPI000535AF75|nr:helix-turn-helix domain-containing protein [Arthrobacter sp. PAMC 25486]AIY01870.1 Transcriptional regulator, AraC family [Arthrobacter sp. PAMC 25486]